MGEKVKVFESEEVEVFEQTINAFISRNDIDITDMQYRTTGLAPDVEYGWHTALVHSVLIRYKEIKGINE